MSKATAIDTNSWDSEVLHSDVPVLVDFWGANCPPCRAIAPILDELSAEFEGRARIFKVDIDSEPDLAVRYTVYSIPNLLFFNKGELVDQLIGAAPKRVLTERLNRLMN